MHLKAIISGDKSFLAESLSGRSSHKLLYTDGRNPDGLNTKLLYMRHRTPNKLLCDWAASPAAIANKLLWFGSCIPLKASHPEPSLVTNTEQVAKSTGEVRVSLLKITSYIVASTHCTSYKVGEQEHRVWQRKL